MKPLQKFPLALSLALAVHGIASADERGPQARLAGFAAFAGSQSNLESLVDGLRHDTPITLAGTTASGTAQSVTFDPPTKPMGSGNVRHALTLARAELGAAGVAQPSPQQIETALMGGTVTTADGRTVALKGVLQLRSQGMGWGQIRHALNLPPTTFAASSHAGAGITTAAGHGGFERTSADTAPPAGHSAIVTAAGTPAGAPGRINANAGHDGGTGRGAR
ncbi:MAG TPA: hypothetical protein VKS43_13150 [Burkholderiales bacterium]|nr:hypothetical protein [Burkholderiales bacterium]